MSIATQWAVSRKESLSTKTDEECFDAAMADKARWLESGEPDLQAFQRDAERQRAIAREIRKQDAMPYCDAEEETLP